MGLYHSSLYSSFEDDCAVMKAIGGSGILSSSMCPPRARSVEVSVTEPVVAFRGRCGGGNREEHDADIQLLRYNEGYQGDFDADWDSTYMYVIYRLEDEELLAAWRKLVWDADALVSHKFHGVKGTHPEGAETALACAGGAKYVRSRLLYVLPEELADMVMAVYADPRDLRLCDCRL